MPRGIYDRSKPRKPCSEETKAKIAASLTGKKHPPERCAATSRGRVGLILTEEHRRAISESVRAAWQRPESRENIIAGMSDGLARTVNGNYFNGGKGHPPNQPMLDFAAVLCPAGYLMDEICILKGPQMNAGHYTLDFGHPEAKVDIEIDGSSHRGKEQRDAERDTLLRSLGWKVIRIRVW